MSDQHVGTKSRIEEPPSPQDPDSERRRREKHTEQPKNLHNVRNATLLKCLTIHRTSQNRNLSSR